MTGATHKTVELDRKLAGLELELAYFRREAALGKRLEKHHTQVEAVAAALAVPVADVRAWLHRTGGAAAEPAEAMIIALHGLWATVRASLVLRYVEHFRDFLVAADALAYRCYEPAVRRGAPCEPPLVCLGSELSPLARPRSGSLRGIPVALIGLPWFQLEHLPDVPLIAHEVGHVVEVDLELGPALDAAVAQALPAGTARQMWAIWRAEAFADVFGTLALGPAFTSTLAGYLSTRAPADGAAHPPRAVRLQLSAATLALTGHATTGWPEPSPEVAAVAAALVGAAGDVDAFTPAAHARAERVARDALGRIITQTTDPRELVAAARLAFDGAPEAFQSAEVGSYVLRAIGAGEAAGTRAGRRNGGASATLRTQRAEAAGAWLSAHLKHAVASSQAR